MAGLIPMAFIKAVPKQQKLRALIFGKSKSGKTLTALLIAEGLAKREGKRIAMIDSEYDTAGSDWYLKRVPQRTVHPEPFDFDRVETKSLARAIEEIKGIDPKVYGVLIVDSLTHFWNAAVDAYEGKRVGKAEDKIPFQAWASIKRPYNNGLIAAVTGSPPFHVIVCSRERSLYEVSDNGKDVELSGVAPQTEKNTEYEFPIVIRMELRRSNEGAVNIAHIEERSGVLSGRAFPNPTFATIEPMLSLLDTDYHDKEDPDERQAVDGELLTQAEDKSAKKAEKSALLLAEFTAKVLSCGSMEALGLVASEVKKQKRYLLEEHANTLRVHYEQARARCAAQAAPEGVI